MKVLRNEQLKDAIIDIVKNAQEKVVIISPYINIANWHSLKSLLSEKSKIGLIIEVHARANTDNKNREKQNIFEKDIQEKLSDIRIDSKNIHLHKNLHAKVYFNEREALITSLNLTSSSLGNVEIGYLTENDNEFEEMLNHFYYPQFKTKTENQDNIMETRKLSLEKDICSTIENIRFIFNDNFQLSNDNYIISIKILEEQNPDLTEEDAPDVIYNLYFYVSILNDKCLQKNFDFQEKALEYTDILCIDQKDKEITVLFGYGFPDRITLENFLFDDMLYKPLNTALIHLLQTLER